MPNEKFMRDLLTTLSHDIRGSFGGVYSLTQMIHDNQQSKSDATTQKRLRLIEAEYITTNQKLVALSKYAKLFDHAQVLESCCLQSIAQQALKKIGSIDPAYKSYVEYFIVEALPTIVGFKAFWRQYFFELFYNSVQHAFVENGVLKAKLSAKQLAAQRQWQITYKDNGSSVCQKDCSYIIRPFKTLQTKAMPLLGAGLGISCLIRIMELHEGTLTLSIGQDSKYTGLRVVGTFANLV